MIPKPSSCIGCPFYKKGEYYTPDKYNPNSKVLFVLQNPGANEQQGRKLIKRHWTGFGSWYDEYEQTKPQPLIGLTGQLFYKKFLPLTGLKENEVSIANAIRCRPGKSYNLRADALPVLSKSMNLETSNADIVKALKHCKEAHLKIPSTTKLIVLMGQYSLYQFTGQTNITNWRGYGFDITYDTTQHISSNVSHYHDLSSNKIAFATLHLAALNEPVNKKFYHATLLDFKKIKRILNKSWPKPLPTYNTYSPSTWPKFASFDTEYSEEERHGDSELHRWSLCDDKYNLYVVENYNTNPFQLPLEDNSTVLIQNAITSDDIKHLSKIINVNKIRLEDLMLAHAILWTGEPHNLNYINSLFGNYNRYKHLSHDNPQLYSALDAIEPLNDWKNGIVPDFKIDKLSWKIYRKYSIPIIKIIHKAQNNGIKIESKRLLEAQTIYQEKVDFIKNKAKEITNDKKFNIGGRKKMLELLYNNSDL